VSTTRAAPTAHPPRAVSAHRASRAAARAPICARVSDSRRRSGSRAPPVLGRVPRGLEEVDEDTLIVAPRHRSSCGSCCPPLRLGGADGRDARAATVCQSKRSSAWSMEESGRALALRLAPARRYSCARSAHAPPRRCALARRRADDADAALAAALARARAAAQRGAGQRGARRGGHGAAALERQALDREAQARRLLRARRAKARARATRSARASSPAFSTRRERRACGRRRAPWRSGSAEPDALDNAEVNSDASSAGDASVARGCSCRVASLAKAARGARLRGRRVARSHGSTMRRIQLMEAPTRQLLAARDER
jgi:hypothetical protein